MGKRKKLKVSRLEGLTPTTGYVFSARLRAVRTRYYYYYSRGGVRASVVHTPGARRRPERFREISYKRSERIKRNFFLSREITPS